MGWSALVTPLEMASAEGRWSADSAVSFGGVSRGKGVGVVGVRTQDDVGFAGFFLEDGLVGLGGGAVDDSHLVVGIRGPDGLHAVFIAHGEGVLVLGVGVVQDVKGIAANVSFAICELGSWTRTKESCSTGRHHGGWRDLPVTPVLLFVLAM